MMKKQIMKTDFVDYVIGNLSDLDDEVYAKRMFGGFGIFYNDKMFALIFRNELFLKTDKSSVTKFTNLGLKPFKYQRQGKEVALSYYQVPAFVLDDSEILTEWSKLSIAIRS